MDSMNVLTKIPKLSGASDVHSQIIDFGERNRNCVTSKEFLACYFEHFKEEEENRDGTIRSKSVEEKELKCSIEEYQQSAPILMENTWHEQLCKCHNCLQIYQKQNVDFLFGIKNIECLPTEILLIIFTHLTPSDRRVASACCKRFLEIWLRDTFIDDRHRLVFDKCLLDPEQEPLSVFLKSSRNYRSLAFGDVIISEKSIFTEKFWENVTTVELMETVFYKMHVIVKLSLLSQFPNLKTLKVADVNQLGDFSNVPTTIELLVISGNCPNLDKLKSYLDKTPDSFRVELNVQISPKQILAFAESQRNKIQRVYLHFQISLTEVFHGINDGNDNEFKMPHFEHLKNLELRFGRNFDCRTEEILDNLEEQCPALIDLSISNIRHRLPHQNWTCLKTLDAWKIPKEEMSRLSIFENLKELTLEASNKCFFIHESFPNKNLKTFNIIRPSKNPCFTCFQTMTKSFPNLENLSCNFQVTNNHLEELAINTPQLKNLGFSILSNLDPSASFACLPNLTKLRISKNLTNHLIETWPLMFQLRRLNIRLSPLNFDTVKIFERTPALEYLIIFCDEIDGGQVSVFDALTKPLKRLEEIRFICGWFQLEAYPEIIDGMAENCNYLRRIDFRNYKTNQPYASEAILKQLLEKHSSIRCIDDVWLK